MAKRKPLVSVGGRIVQLKDEDTIDSSAVPSLRGDTAPYVNQTITYTITNFSSFSTYSVSISAGGVSIDGDTITVNTPIVAGVINLTLIVDGKPSVFNIDVQASAYIVTPNPTPLNFGDPFEGGFYAGMVWEQLTRSSTSTALANVGEKTFTVPNMTGAPIVYIGQTLEVRSRANPANKFIGTVVFAGATNLTINVTTISGTGTFSDWSIMARYRIIVAPKSGGEHSGIAIKNSQTDLPVACQSLTEGFTATQAMKDTDTSTVYPAAHWVRNLTVGGKSDWYIPARDELELCWRNLKPVTTNNYSSNDRPTGATRDYKRDGSYGDTSASHGNNNNASPVSVGFTSTVPAETTSTVFKSGRTEAFEFGSAFYWCTTEYATLLSWGQHYNSTYPGNQAALAKTLLHRVRAVRRSII